MYGWAGIRTLVGLTGGTAFAHSFLILPFQGRVGFCGQPKTIGLVDPITHTFYKNLVKQWFAFTLVLRLLS